jgi:hypothetical protein
MPTIQTTVRRALACGVCGAAVAGALASGCGGDDASSDGGPMMDVGADRTDGTTPDAPLPDTSLPDSSQSDAPQPDTSQQGDGTQNDVRQDVVGMDTRALDGNDAADDSADAAVPGEASDGGRCSTSIASLASGAEGGLADSGSDGSVNDAAGPLAPSLLFGFDNPGGLDLGWSGYTGSNSTALLGETVTDGYTCPGALAMNVTYSGYGVNSGAIFNYGGGAAAKDWTGRTKLHAWIKLTTSDYTVLGGVQQIVDSNGYAVHRYGGYLPATLLSDGKWHESVVSLVPPAPDAATVDYVPTIVNEFQFQLLSQGAQVDGGPAAPPPAALLVDDIWLE